MGDRRIVLEAEQFYHTPEKSPVSNTFLSLLPFLYLSGPTCYVNKQGILLIVRRLLGQSLNLE